MAKKLKPTFHQVRDLSRFLRVPFGYLLLDELPKDHLPLLEFRTVDTEAIEHPSRELVNTIYDMQLKQKWLWDVRIADSMERLHFVNSLPYNEDIDHLNVANAIRAY